MKRLLLLLAACAPPQPAAEIVPLEIPASFDKTWAATIDIFAKQGIPIATIDKSSGLIVSQTMSVNQTDGMNWADCGTNLMDIRYVSHGHFNVLVRGTETGSSVRSTARFTSAKGGSSQDCPSKGVWERSFQLRIKNAITAP